MTSTSDLKRKEEQLVATINQKLTSSGEKERLKEYLRAKLVEQGWRDEMKSYCKEIIKAKGAENITAEELVAEITPRGREKIPAPLKADLLQRIRKFLASMQPPAR